MHNFFLVIGNVKSFGEVHNKLDKKFKLNQIRSNIFSMALILPI